jgi:hypothetical protein
MLNCVLPIVTDYVRKWEALGRTLQIVDVHGLVLILHIHLHSVSEVGLAGEEGSTVARAYDEEEAGNKAKEVGEEQEVCRDDEDS